MKAWSAIRGRSRFTLRGSKGMARTRLLKDPLFSVPGGWLKSGAFSLLLHGILGLALILGIQPHGRESRPPVYRVTVLPLQMPEKELRPKDVKRDRGKRLPALPAKVQTHKVRNEPVREIKPKEVVLPEKEPDQVVPAAVDARASVSTEEIEPFTQPPIPLPMAALSEPNINSEKESDENLPILLSSSRVAEVNENVGPGKGAGEGPGPGTGSGGTEAGGSGDGAGGGRGDSSGGEVGIRLRVGRGGSTEGHVGKGPGKGPGTREGTSGPGGNGSGESGNGRGSGREGGGSGNSVHGGSGMPHPRYADNPKPVYPREAREKRYEGEVLLRVEVLSNGRVGQIEVKRSSGHEMLDQSAFTAVKQWRFIPAMKGDTAIPFWVNIPIRFRLL